MNTQQLQVVGMTAYALLGILFGAVAGVMLSFWKNTHRSWLLLGAIFMVLMMTLFFGLVFIASEPSWLTQAMAMPIQRSIAALATILGWIGFAFLIRAVWLH